MKQQQLTTPIGLKMLSGYSWMKQKRWEDVVQLLAETKLTLDADEHTLADWAGWLWLLGEYSQQANDQHLVMTYKQSIEEIVERIAANWAEPAIHWIYQQKSGIYLSQVALYYAALRSASFMIVSDTALRASKEMRAKLFVYFMNGIAMVSEKGTTEVNPDIVLAAVPFGYFTPGDLALLKGLEVINDEELRSEEAAFFSWYYAECGKLTKASVLSNRALSTTDAASTLLVESVAQLLTTYQQVEGITFDHQPLGSECPYFVEQNERYPRIVLENDEVTVQAVIHSVYNIAEVTLVYRINDEMEQQIQMNYTEPETEEQAGYWRGVLPCAAAYHTVTYYFCTTYMQENYESKRYSYDVHRWEECRLYGLDSVAPSKKYWYQLEEQSVYAYVMIGKQTAKGIEYQLHFSQQEEMVAGVHSIAVGEAGDTLPILYALLNSERQVVKVKLEYPIDQPTRWFGMGERFAQLEYSNCELDNYVYNQYKDQGHRTYIPKPLAIGTGGFGIFLASSLYSKFDFGAKQQTILEIEANVSLQTQQLHWYQLVGAPTEQIQQYCHCTSLPKLPPKWAFGPWMSSNNWDSEQETSYQLDQNKKYQIAATVIVLEQWSDEATFYIFNDAQYEPKQGEERFVYDDFTFPAWGRWPDPKRLVDRIHEDGLRLLLWQAPVMKYMEGLVHRQHDLDEAVMLERHYMVREADGEPYRIPSFEWFRGSLVPDFTNETAAAWWLAKRQYLLDEIGIDGFKTDGGECIYGSELQFADGRTGAEMRNEYPNKYVETFHQFADQFVAGGAITFSRAGYSGAQATPMHWAGDEKSTFAAFRSSLIAGLSSGLSGIPFWGWDFGGFSGEIPSAELFIRSLQMAVFSPVMQYHAESKGQFNMDRTPWNIAERRQMPNVIPIYKRFADLRMNLLPYIYEQAQRSANTGEPLMRAHCLDFPQDATASQLQTQYLFGQALLIAPILEEYARAVDIYFPEGNWLHLFDHAATPIAGEQQCQIRAELADIPVYIRANSVIPVHVSEQLELFSYVGNSVEVDQELMLIVYATGEVDYQFADGAYAVRFSTQGEEEQLSMQVHVEGRSSVVICLKQAASFTSLALDSLHMIRVDEVEQLQENCYLQRGNDILVRLKEGRQIIHCS